ncbi:MAG: DUF2125 domain-containing protein [Pseudorhodoplanes sp.]|nr:DUF2125 domain-containing protein [Pseudorhodoplanes sp.]
MPYDRAVQPPSRRRSWLIAVPAALLLAIALAWCGVWFYAASRAQTAMTGWLDREARAGRIYTCGSHTVGGFPFRIEVRCDKAAAELRALQPPLAITAPGILVAAQVWQPTLLISEFTGPLHVGDVNAAPELLVNWSLAQASVRGNPRRPERISIVMNDPVFDRTIGGTAARVAAGKHAELHARMADGAWDDRPVIDIALELSSVSAPALGPFFAAATDASADINLRGLKDFSPKPWSVRFREIQQSNGAIDVRTIRMRQSEWLATGSGRLGLTANGRLDGELRVTIAGLERLLQQLGVDYLSRPGSGSERAGAALDALDRIAPGLGAIAREKAAPSLAAGFAAMLGQPAEIEGRKAVSLPLRFVDGEAFLGPIRIGKTQSLF